MAFFAVFLFLLSAHQVILQELPIDPPEIPNISGSVVSSDDYQWGAWGRWSECSRSCDGGIRRRQRLCYFYELRQAGSSVPVNSRQALDINCPGNNIDEASCNEARCLPCLTQWSQFGSCQGSCGIGEQVRRRQCNCPRLPGNECDGAALVERQPCQLPECCEIGAWSEWSFCSSPCNGGVQSRSRTTVGDCTLSSNQLSQSRSCNQNVPCGWTIWGSWSSCDLTFCYQKRERTCPSKTCERAPFMLLRECKPSGLCVLQESLLTLNIPITYPDLLRSPNPQPQTQPQQLTVLRELPTFICPALLVDRVACDNPEGTEKSCVDLGCCYDASIQGNPPPPSCFQKINKTSKPITLIEGEVGAREFDS